ncbi:hypothetical protein ACP70R_030781 [Stipagrostis hirtigluma subsp. patula]
MAVPRVSADDDGAADLSLALAAPPLVTHITLSQRVSSANPHQRAGFGFPCVLAADPSGLLLTITPPPTEPPSPLPTTASVSSSDDDGDSDGEDVVTINVTDIPGPACFVLDVPSATASRVPDHRRISWDGLGVIAGDAGYMLAAFDHIVGCKGAKLICFSSQTGEWVTKNVRNPLRSWIWNFQDVVSHDGKLWWVDTAGGLLACDPFANHPHMAFVPLPGEGQSDDDQDGDGAELLQQGENDDDDEVDGEDLLEQVQSDDDELPDEHGCCSYCSARDAGSRRRVMLSDGKFRCVETSCAHQSGAPTFAMRTLADPETAEWTLEYEVCFAEIWADDSYKAAGLPEKAPVVALIHPKNPDVLYFFLGEFLFGVDMRAKKVVECVPHELSSEGGASSSSVLAWELPPALASGTKDQTEEKLSPRSLPSDMMSKE